jgi:hypothetical protein
MAAATSVALQDRVAAPVVNGLSVQYAFSFNEAQNLDLIQIASPGDQTGGAPTVMINVDYLGKVHSPAVNPTNGTVLGVFYTQLTQGSTATLFAAAFDNPLLLDILQVINPGGNISYWLDYLGVVHGA